jgi:hypothetical protein
LLLIPVANILFFPLPSAVATILQYRCGQIPSLGSRYFTKYRDAVETVRGLTARIRPRCYMFSINDAFLFSCRRLT